MKPVAVIGGGITGLTAAFRLQRNGIPVTVYEASERAGGVIQTHRSSDGYLAEFGPNTLLETSPKISGLIDDLGLQSRRLDSNPAAKNRYLVRDRCLQKMPDSLFEFIATPLFSAPAKLRVLLEPFVRRGDNAHEESIGDFVQRRLGPEFLDQAIDALVGGIYAGDPRKLSVSQAFPKLYALEQEYGSLIKGQILGARKRRRSGEKSKAHAQKLSFDDGLQVLPNAICAALKERIRLNSAVTAMTQHGKSWRVHFHAGGVAEHAAVIYAGTAFALSKIEIQSRHPLDVSAFEQIEYPPIATVALGFRCEDVAHPLDGFGMLIPRCEGLQILGSIFSSSLFPGRAPTGHVCLTSYIGGARSPELAQQSADELFALTLCDLRQLLGIRGQPTFRHHVLFPRAIPQYNLGYQAFRDAMSQIEATAPGLFFAGHYRDGISVSDCIVSGANAAARIAQHLAASHHEDLVREAA